MFKLPFGWWPGHYGLKGKTREIAKAEYELSGYDLEKKLLDIRKDEFNEDEYSRKSIEINKKYKKYNQWEYEQALLSLIKDDKQRSLAEAELEYKQGKIKDIEYEKKIATIKGEPWVTVINMDFGKSSAMEGSFELDWNEHFVEKLKSEGYNAPKPDLIVNQWFMEICRNIALEEFDGVGNFTADSQANLDTFKRWNDVESFPEGRKGYK